MLIAMTCNFNDSPVVLEIAADADHMIDQLCNWVVDGVLTAAVQAQVTTACAQPDVSCVDDSFDRLLPILLEPEGMVVYIQNVEV